MEVRWQQNMDQRRKSKISIKKVKKNSEISRIWIIFNSWQLLLAGSLRSSCKNSEHDGKQANHERDRVPRRGRARGSGRGARLDRLRRFTVAVDCTHRVIIGLPVRQGGIGPGQHVSDGCYERLCAC